MSLKSGVVGPDPGEIGALVALVNDDRLSDAERGSRTLLARYPTAGMLWKILSVAQTRQGKDPLQALRKAAELMPQDAEAHCNLGAALHDREEWPAALASLRRALVLQPDNVEALVDAANAMKALAQAADAVPLYQRAIALDPRHVEARNNLGNAFLELRRLEEAAGCYRSAGDLKPGDAQILINLGAVQRQLGLPDEALTNGRRAVACDPANVQALTLLGDLLRDVGSRREAASAYARAVELDPNRAENHCNLGTALFEMRRISEAAACYRQALALNPGFAPAHLSLGVTLRQQRHPAEAEASCRAALAIDPRYVEALAFLGELHADHGRFSEAEDYFRRALAIDPDFSFAYSSIATHRRMTLKDSDWLKGAEALLTKRLPLANEIGLRHSLGKYFDDLGQYDRAFENYARAKELTKRYGATFHRVNLTRYVDRIMNRFDAEFVRGRLPEASTSEVPVFILGMPRSGTSLAEQILASHPAVFGAGEVTFWNSAYQAFQAAEAAAGSGMSILPRIAADYLDRLAAISGESQRVSGGILRVVDKLPANFLYAGLIHAAFPKARIIHMQRHPVDTCLSIFFQHFFNIGAYANDLEDLAHYYREYLRITNHWRTVLPSTTLLEVPYESLIRDQELWTRRMLEFVGLPWDPKCLDFHRTERVVITASKWQVRQKLNPSSAGRWRNYEKFLGPLRGLMDEAPGDMRG